MTTKQYDTPAPSTGGKFFSVKNNEGALVAFDVKNFDPTYTHPRFNETKPTVFADVTIIDGDNKGDVYLDSDISHAVLVRQLQSKVGRSVLGRLQKNVPTKNGKAWGLDAPSEDDVTLAQAFEDKAPWED